MFGQFRPRSGLNINMQINRGEQIDYTNSRLADQRRIQPQIDWNATRHLLVRLRYTSDRLSSQGRADDIRRQAHGLAAHLAVQRAQLRALDAARSGHRAQRRPLRQPALTDPNTSSLATQLLYSYKLNPQTVLFAGYSDNSIDDDATGELEMTGRTLFFKLSYAWTP